MYSAISKKSKARIFSTGKTAGKEITMDYTQDFTFLSPTAESYFQDKSHILAQVCLRKLFESLQFPYYFLLRTIQGDQDRITV